MRSRPDVQAVRVGDLIYTAGQGGLDPATGKMVEGGVEAQANQTMLNLAKVLEAAGSNFNHVVKTNIFLRYMKDFATVNDVYASFFERQFPARSTVAVSALPMAALVEIEMVVLVIEAETTEAETTEVEETAAVEESKAKKGKKKKRDSKRKKEKREEVKKSSFPHLKFIILGVNDPFRKN